MRRFRPPLFVLGGVALLALVATGPLHAQSSGANLFAGFQTKSTDPIHVDAGSLEIFEEGKTRVSVFSGGVVVKRGLTTMKASTIKLYSASGDKPVRTDAFSRIEANGSVYVTSGPQTVTGDKAVVDMTEQTIVLTGKVVLSQGDSVMTGDRLVVYMKTGRVRLEQFPGNRINAVLSPDDANPKPAPAKP